MHATNARIVNPKSIAMLTYKIYIPHINTQMRSPDHPIVGLPYHRWEHIFIRIIKNYFYQSKSVYSGYCTVLGTTICMEGNVTDTDLSRETVIALLRNKYITNRDLKREVIRINDELACMGRLYDISICKCEFDNPLNRSDMMRFRRDAYDWDNVQISVDNHYKEPAIMNKGHRQKDRRTLLQCEIALLEMDINQKIKAVNSNDFSLEKLNSNYCFLGLALKYSCLYEDIQRIYSCLDDDNGFYQYAICDRYPICFFAKPIVQLTGDEVWIKIYSYIKQRNIKYFVDLNISIWKKYLNQDPIMRYIVIR